jgi:hypothetical protein
MGEFFLHREPDRKQLWLYSERGLVSYLIQHLLLEDPDSVLRAASNGRQTLYEESGAPFHRHVAIGEFQLGPQGFGSPDGGLLGIHENSEKVFVFIEAKAVLERASFQDPTAIARRVEGLDFDRADGEAMQKLLDDNTFNSSLNGQIEMRWRFVNAFRQGPMGAEMRITEQALPMLPRELQSTDRFYWRQRLRPNPGEVDNWRRVSMRDSKQTNLLPLYDLMRGASTRFFLLVITPETRPPALIRAARLFTPEGNQRVDAGSFVFWLPLRYVCDHLERP